MLDVTHVGSNWNNSVNTSTFYWNLNNSSANSNRNIATHLFYAVFLVFYKNMIYLASWQKITDRAMWVSRFFSKPHTLCMKQKEFFSMKRKGNLYEKIYDIENLRVAHAMARKNKTHYKEVQMVDEDVDKYLYIIQNKLKTLSYKTSEYTLFKINDNGKEREIAKLPYFPDRIVHWAIMLVIEPVFMNTFISTTYASLPNRGGHKALHKLEYDLRNNDLTYCLKMDIKKFFPSINKDILKTLLRKKFKDSKLLFLLDGIIDSYHKGIPIGNYLSQYFANFYLNYLDHFIKETLLCKYYYRYMDDMVILSDSKTELHEIKNKIEEYIINNLDLKLKGNYQVFPIDKRGIDFLGYVIFSTHTKLRKTIVKRIKSKHYSIKKVKVTDSDRCSLMSYFGWVKHGDCKNFSKKYITNNVWRADHEVICKRFTYII